METIDITMGRLYVAEAPAVLATSSIGSCVAICLWSQITKKGALAHIMLPKRPDGGGLVTEDDFRYCDIAVQVMVKDLESRGVKKDQLVAKIVGGANMFPGIQARSQRVGEKNVESVKEILAQYQIPIAAEEIGGSVGRAVTFDLGNGIVNISMTI